jgi:DNA-binding CsgD family transcriptional regulator
MAMKCGPEECPIVAFSDLTQAEQRVERKRIARKMMDQGFTQEQIARQLGVNQATIARDLEGLCTVHKPSRPKGGRPKDSRKPRSERMPKAVEREETVAALRDAGLTAAEIGAKVGLGERAVHQALEHDEIRREAVADIDPATMSMTAQKKMEIWQRQEKARLAAQFEKFVRDEVRRRMDEIVLPDLRKQIEQARTFFDRRKGFMNKDTYNKIRFGLHPDKLMFLDGLIPAEKYRELVRRHEEGFHALKGIEKYLLVEKDSPTHWPPLPRNLAEWDAAKQKAGAERRSRRAARGGVEVASR